jgi:HD superfamily phosphohydrolase
MPERPLVHRDQVHGDTYLDQMCVALLNTAPLQRLGRVYQLGYAHLVFRGGTHTRLSHVMGAAHTSGRIVDSLVRNYSVPEQFRPPNVVAPEDFLPFPGKPLHARWDFLRHVTRWAALLHDLGHVPLGHTLEDEFDNLFEKHDDFSSPRMPMLWHEHSGGGRSPIRTQLLRPELYPDSFKTLEVSPEMVWRTVMVIAVFKEKRAEAASGKEGVTFDSLIQDFIDNAAELAKRRRMTLGDQVKFAKELLDAYMTTRDSGTFSPYMADIVGNTICADYLDYLQRDAANVGLDVLRDDRVVSQFYVGRQDSTGAFRMALSLVDRRGKDRLDTCTGVVELVRQRFRFAEIIYYHKTKVAASAMFAKSIRLLDKSLIEVRKDAQPELSAEKVNRDWAALQKDRKALQSLRSDYLPESLTDVEIGDEGLYPFLQSIAWRDVETATAAKDFDTVHKRLRALLLIRGITTRRLYKVAMMMDAHAFAELSPGSKNPAASEERIRPQIQRLRSNHDYRAAIEDKIVSATGWSDADDALILYVPPRKSQAKGIETFALDNEGLVTLSDHPAVQAKVSELNRDYSELWRMILLVDPARRDDDVALSAAIDALIGQLWPKVKLRDESVVSVIRKAAWFEYILPSDRAAAAEFVSVMRETDKKLNWSIFKDVRDRLVVKSNGIVSGRELAYRSVLFTLVKPNIVMTKEIEARYATRLLVEDVEAQLKSLPAASRDGISSVAAAARALEAIATAVAAPQLLLTPER